MIRPGEVEIGDPVFWDTTESAGIRVAAEFGGFKGIDCDAASVRAGDQIYLVPVSRLFRADVEGAT